MMRINLCSAMAGVVLALSLSSASWAGGPRGGVMMVHPPGGWHGVHAGGAAGRRPGAMPPGGVPRRFAVGGQDRFRFGYGHVTTGIGRLRPQARLTLRRARGFGYADGPGGYDGGVYGPGVYAGSGGSVDVGGTGDVGPFGSTETGYYGAGYAGQGYAEPPLNAIGGAGGAKILKVNGTSPRTCACRNTEPTVYRFGVGSYY